MSDIFQIKTTDSDSASLGSNPSPPATLFSANPMVCLLRPKRPKENGRTTLPHKSRHSNSGRFDRLPDSLTALEKTNLSTMTMKRG